MPETADKKLIILMAGSRVGIVSQGDDGRLALEYDEEWRSAQRATPLSLSLPLSRRTHDDPVVRSVLWGLLPDNERVLERWARDYRVSAGNPFARLRHVGEDCAGAAQLVVPARVDAVVSGDGGVRRLDEGALAERLRTLRADPTSWHVHNSGQFSLAGAQAKTALYLDPATHQWGEPWGATPTTHILKPAVAGLDEHDLNEHLCLAAAGLAGLQVAHSFVVTFERERAIAIERYDRQHQSAGGPVRRVHQEDMCQALGVAPTVKYQSEGGPSPEQIIDLLQREIRPKRVADAHVDRFVNALAFNWIIAGTDAHAKNYSLLLSGRQVRLARCTTSPAHSRMTTCTCPSCGWRCVSAARTGSKASAAGIGADSRRRTGSISERSSQGSPGLPHGHRSASRRPRRTARYKRWRAVCPSGW